MRAFVLNNGVLEVRDTPDPVPDPPQIVVERNG
jgi:hypothetical protein